ncbi:MAG: heparinase [Cytophagaceae bacterium SCN 52-12]|nr:MAG: heparinase [Cytophagaceae bacterium SCN 52-12]
MKKSFIFLLIGLVTACGVFAQAVTGTGQISVRLKQLGGEHPRILIRKGDIESLRDGIPGSAIKSRIHHDILEACDAILKMPQLERELEGRRLLGKSRESLRRIFYLSYGYRMTGKQAYLKRAEEEILTVCHFSDWNPSHFLDVGEMTMSVAIGYDWLYDKLSEETRQLAREAIVEKGIKPSYNKDYNWFVKGTNNWNQVCHAGMVFGALAIAEFHPELSADVIQRAIEFVPNSMQFYAPDGAYPEGYMYWDYGTTFNVLLIDAIEKAFGEDFGLSRQEGFLETASYEQNMIGPSLLVHNWGDSGPGATLSPALFWFARKTNDPTLLWFQNKIITDGKKRFTGDRILPALLLWAGAMEVDRIGPPSEKVWTGQGKSPVGLMRTSWTDPEPVFVGFKAGSASVSHAHMDAGSFVIDAKGERWAMDFGMQNYHSLESRGVNLWNMAQDSERWKVFRYNNFVHNTITVNDQLHNVKGYSKIERSSDQPDNMFFTTDLTEMFTPHIGKAKRAIGLQDKSRVVIRDEITTDRNGAKVRWSFLTPAKARIVGNDLVELTQNGKTMYLQFQSSAGLALKTWSTVSPNDYDADNGDTMIVGFEAELPANKTEYFDVIFSEKKEGKIAVKPIDEW